MGKRSAPIYFSSTNISHFLISKSCLGSPCSEDKCVKACPEGWEANGDHCYLFGDEKKNWTAAEDFCRGEGGHLATVDTNATKEFVLEGLTRRNSALIWIGGSDIEEEGVWKWTDCTQWEVEFWAPRQPTNLFNNEDCLQLVLRWDTRPDHSGKWNDEPCVQKYEFLCSKKICRSIKGKTSCSCNFSFNLLKVITISSQRKIPEFIYLFENCR